ncbi:TonB-dependent receptor [Zavarzinia compransoris]|uniref:TonB-dependent siderophore receptor n=1 Tax=Zavarzinia compransoris TaxID=1264899 RepID=A0A317E2T7_9PROT|nr:TonB-dependent siderophore receptor [Zavarzinia compransoris]PWR20466.1 TonB-dependent siderophore receptor [Zavarzinia compransoris]TDP43891.1 catecholate siderophore receptor [Zavarzinia compransoris]
MHHTVTTTKSRRKMSPLVSRAALAAVAAGLGFVPAAQAQQPAAGQAVPLPTVRVEGAADDSYKADTVESPRQTAPILDAPQTINVIPRRLIEEQGATDLTEVLRSTPGISFDAGENGFSTSTNNFTLRGFDTSGNIFVDGARSSGSYTRDVFNLEQVEVFKGATGDSGRGGAGGYINLQTKTPHLGNAYSGNVGLGFDEYDSELRTRASIDANHQIGETAALRLNVMAEGGGVAGREEAEQNAWGVAPSLSLGLGTSFRTTIAYEHVEHNDLPDWGVPGAVIANTDAFNPATRGFERDNFYGLATDFDDVVSDSLLARFEWDIDTGVTLSNQTRWNHVDRNARYTVPTGYTAATNTVTGQTQFYDRSNTSFSNLTSLALAFDTAGLKHRAALGLELTRERSEANRYGTQTPPATGLDNPNPDRAASARLAPTEVNEIDISTVALDAYDTIELSRHWEITGGLRAEWYEVDIDSRTAAGAPAGTANGYNDEEFELGGRIGLVYKPVDNGSIYISYGVSAQPPGSYLSNPDISRTGDNAFPGFVPNAEGVTNYNYELGTKWSFNDGKLQVTGALFRTEKHDVPITGRDVGETVDSLKGYGKQVVEGLEIGVAGEILEGWNVFGGVLLMDSAREHSAYLDSVRRRANTADYDTFTSTDGDELAFTPNISGNLWTTYRFPFGLTVGAGARHTGSVFLGRPDDALRIIPNGRYGKLPAFTTYHALIAYDVTENVNVRLNIDNIFDETYATTTNWNGSRATLGAPRSFLLTTGFSF